MTRSIHFDTVIDGDRKLEVVLPADVPEGAAEVTVTVRSKDQKRRSTTKDLLNSEIVGMWADREDITDSTEYVKELRRQSWKASPKSLY